MGKRIIVTESERTRILEMHKNHKMKELINEDDRGTSLKLRNFEGEITAKLLSYSDESIDAKDQFPEITAEIQDNPTNSLIFVIPGYSWKENERFTVVVELPDEFKERISLPNDTPRATLTLRDDGKQIFIQSRIQDSPNLFIDGFQVNGLIGGPLSIQIMFNKDTTVINKDTSNNPITKNYVNTWNIYPVINGNLDVSKMYQVETKTVTYSPKSGMLSIPLTNSKSGEENYLHYKCGQDLQGESGKVVVTLDNGDTVAIDEKKMNSAKQIFCPAPLTSSK